MQGAGGAMAPKRSKAVARTLAKHAAGASKDGETAEKGADDQSLLSLALAAAAAPKGEAPAASGPASSQEEAPAASGSADGRKAGRSKIKMLRQHSRTP